MLINLNASAATLEDVDNFKAFKVATNLPQPELSAALAGPFSAVGRPDGTHLWINVPWLKANGRPDDAAWRANFEKMLDYAKTAGWVDEQGAIRAHIETDYDT